MKVYHVTSMKKLLKYKSEGVIRPPVRAHGLMSMKPYDLVSTLEGQSYYD
jgi:hypothetical protein